MVSHLLLASIHHVSRQQPSAWCQKATGARVEWEAGAYRAFNKHGTGAGATRNVQKGGADQPDSSF